MGLPAGFTVVFSCLLVCNLAYNIDTNTSQSVFVARGSKKDIYFGYSLGFLKHTSGHGSVTVRLLVGAPKGDQNAIDWGDLYECDVDKPPETNVLCRARPIDSGDNSEVKEGQWLGASISTSGNDYVVCAPRYAKYDNNNLAMRGKCIVSIKGTRNPITPCKTFGEYSYCQAGMSALLTDSKLVFGAPGANSGERGAVLVNDRSSTGSFLSTPTDGTDNGFYLGYSVATGNFNNDSKTIEIAGGMSRGSFTGKVMIYKESTKDGINLLSTILPPDKVALKGESIAFGSSLIAVDLNNDSYDDLVVGAPFYSDKGDEGRVYVYINQKFNDEFPKFKLSSGESEVDPGLKGDNKLGARFGWALAAAGDLNNDGNPDIIVGAPHDGDGNGAIYIYHGSNDGIIEVYQQKITAADMQSRLGVTFKQFGYAITGGTDTDGNEYPDIAVGAWESDNALILRTRPVMDVEAILTLSKPNIPVENATMDCKDKPGSQCMNATICFKYYGKGVSGAQELDVTFEMDTGATFKRVYREDAAKKEIYKLNENVTLTQPDVENCIHFNEIYIKDRKELVQSDDNFIYFMARYSLVRKPECDTKLCPILAKTPEPKIEQSATLIFNCTDNSCDYDLQISIRSNLKKIVITATETVLVEVTLRNNDEQAYNPEITVRHDATLQYEKLIKTNENDRVERRISASANASTTELFRIVGVLENHQSITFQLQYSSKKVADAKPSLDITVEATAKSGKESYPDDNNATISFAVERDISMKIVGKSVPKALTYPKTALDIPTKGNRSDFSKFNASSLGESLSITFVLTNSGSSPLDNIDFQISYPFRERDDGNEQQYLVYPIKVAPSECETKVLDPENLESRSVSGGENNTDEKQSKRRERRDVEQLDSRRKQAQTITCSIKQELPPGKAYTMDFETRVWFPTLAKFYPRDIALKIDAKATYKNKLENFNTTTVNGQLTIMLTAENVPAPAKKTPVWIIIVAVLGGILLLALLFFALFKFGFFKRNRPPKDISSPQSDDAPEVPS